MAVAWRSVGTYVSRSAVNTTTVTVPQPAGHQAGDVLLLVAGTFNSTTGATINTPSGWTLLAAGGPYNSNVGAGNYYVAAFYKIAASSSEASVSMTTSAASFLDCQITAFSGGDGTTPIDANTTWQRGGVSSTTFPFQAITTLTNNALLVYLAADFDGSAYNTPPTGATERSESTTFAVKFIVATETKTPAGTEAADSYTKASGADGGSGIVIAVREAGASAAPLSRPATNYIAGTGITVAAADNPTLDAVDVTIASTVTGGIPAAIVDVKGDLIAATAADTVGRLAAGTNGQLLAADSTQTTGLRWTAAPAAVTYGTTLPASPADGQEHILVDSTTTPTYQWRFRYNAGSTVASKWEFIGGAPLRAAFDAAETPAATGSWTALPTPSPAIAVPRGGDYLATVSARLSGVATAGNAHVGAANASLTNTAVGSFGSLALPNAAATGMAGNQTMITNMTAGQTIRLVVIAGAAGQLFDQRTLLVTPVRCS